MKLDKDDKDFFVLAKRVLEDTIEDICNIMSQTPEWAKGLLLKADGYECESYRKM